jgi:hypothetical protein
MEQQTKSPEIKLKHTLIKVDAFVLERTPGLKWIIEEERIHRAVIASPDLLKNISQGAESQQPPEPQLAMPIDDRESVQSTIHTTETPLPRDI